MCGAGFQLLTKTGSASEFEEASKPRCPECLQPLTFVRTRSQQKKWYCYSCEKYTDHFAETAEHHSAEMSRESLTGLQVIDYHGTVVGRVSRVIHAETDDSATLTVDVEKESLKTLLRNKGILNEVEIGRDKVLAIGDVVILSEVFSPSLVSKAGAVPSSSPESNPRELGEKYCPTCAAEVLRDASFCIVCGKRL
jgi:sporulation protein YlmC with PRC-barrel domain